MSTSLSWALLSFALPLFPSQPLRPRGESGWVGGLWEDWLSLSNINYSLETLTHAVLVLGLSPYRIATLRCVWPQCQWGLTYCHMCTYCVRPICLFLSHRSAHDRQPLLTDRGAYYYSANSIGRFSLTKKKQKTKHWAALALWSSQGSFCGNELTRSSTTNSLSKTIWSLSGLWCRSPWGCGLKNSTLVIQSSTPSQWRRDLCATEINSSHHPITSDPVTPKASQGKDRRKRDDVRHGGCVCAHTYERMHMSVWVWQMFAHS